jgi:trigger factor
MGIHEVPEDKAAELHGALAPAAVKHVKARFLLDATAKAEGLEVSEEELTSELNRQIAAAGSAADRVRAYYSERVAIAQLHANMLRDKALEKLVEFSAQREEEVDRSELADGR